MQLLHLAAQITALGAMINPAQLTWMVCLKSRGRARNRFSEVKLLECSRLWAVVTIDMTLCFQDKRLQSACPGVPAAA